MVLSMKKVNLKELHEILMRPTPKLTWGAALFVAVLASLPLFFLASIWALLISVGIHSLSIGLVLYIASVFTMFITLV